ncbi:MAG: type II toxin-antitoxin system RelE/ParE family toxin [Oleiphilaceae bacterium]|nr:type II toxin-antitoxin system RelE/ParE family toxin [Oleiphilaceae bacterium]
MYNYQLSLSAKEDLRRIYSYGYRHFGEEQADKYYFGFFSTFEKISSNPFLYQSVDHIRAGYRRCPYGSDSIYYRINGNTIEIMAILSGQDLDVWL